MHRLPKTVPPLLLLALAISVGGCSTLYREKIYSPGKSHYKKPPEKAVSADLLPPAPAAHGNDALLLPPAGAAGAAPDGGAPAPGGAAPGIPGMDAMPAIPGLPPP